MDPGRQQLSCLPISECKSEGAPESKLKWVDTVNILGIEYGIKEKAWGGNWTDWEEKVMLKITMWKKWSLAMYQKAVYIQTYLIPPVHNLAVVYPPPLDLLRRVESQIFRLVWHTASFPLARAVAFKEVEWRGLALPALQPYFVTEFMSYSFGNWIFVNVHDMSNLLQKTWVSLFALRWRKSAWGIAWWGKGSFNGNITQVLKREHPDYLRDLLFTLKKWKVELDLFKGSSSIKQLRKTIYGEILEVGFLKPDLERKRYKHRTSQYLLQPDHPIALFKEKKVPFHLWETRWRLYHQVLPLNAAKPWLPEDQQEYPKITCKQKASELGKTFRETHSHFLKECVVAKRVWQGVSKLLEWPDLEKQTWEELTSGLSDRNSFRGPRKKPSRKRDGTGAPIRGNWNVPLLVIRLVNLYVIYAMLLHRNREGRRDQEVHADETVNLFWKSLYGYVQKDKSISSKQKWDKLWKWTSDVTPRLPDVPCNSPTPVLQYYLHILHNLCVSKFLCVNLCRYIMYKQPLCI
ncbi:uncharacterized protein LOC128323586 [Hemicordylus capensis]|uniref:uncharacterized protein LOC128323586 n=1 Tax=Hemicordylus capensis TaxID=884348 RepID=UPI00230303B5|nr:uncharacterized protein LOC128323586 [Hemicordylus capensis]